MTETHPEEATTMHTRILRCTLATDDSHAYWRNVDLSVPLEQRIRLAFERRWFGLKSEARVDTLMRNMAERFDAFPEALALLQRLPAIPAALRPWICHLHTQLSDPLYRRFTGEYLPQRRAQGLRTLDRDTVARWVDSLEPGRWSVITCRKFGTNLVATAVEAGLLGKRRDPRELTDVNVPEQVLGYALYLLRTVRMERALGDDPYLRSLRADREMLPSLLQRVPGVTYQRLGRVEELDWQYPSLTVWGVQVLGGEA
ncbi:MAG TPA: hypothetical protein VFS67_08320 [Polyangiaceae bacterium]|nr:hypothetical protein [Polyangiaceae bacterium]